MNRYPAIAAGIAGVVLLGAIALVAMQLGLLGGSGVPAESNRVWFAADEANAAPFAAEITNIPPWTKDGKQVYRAEVYRCGDGQPFVGYIVSYAPEAKAKMQAVVANPGKAPVTRARLEAEAETEQIQVKKPGAGEWVPLNDPRVPAITEVKCPDGKLAQGVSAP
jgi:hypothetical protein